MNRLIFFRLSLGEKAAIVAAKYLAQKRILKHVAGIQLSLFLCMSFTAHWLSLAITFGCLPVVSADLGAQLMSFMKSVVCGDDIFPRPS